MADSGGKRLLVKLDVEGFELEVLAGAAGTLDRIPKPTWLVEIMLSGELIPSGMNSRFAETFAMFWEHGYCCHKLDPARTPLGPDEVSRWIRNGSVNGDTHDFLFSGRPPSETVEELPNAEESGRREEERNRMIEEILRPAGAYSSTLRAQPFSDLGASKS